MPALNRDLLEECRQCLNRIELTHDKFRLPTQTLRGQERLPGEPGTQLIQLGARTQVVGQIPLAPLGYRPVHLGNPGFNIEDGSRLGGSILLTSQCQHPLNVRRVLRAQVHEHRIIFQVIVTIRQAESTLHDHHNVAIRILLVCGNPNTQRRFEIEIRASHEVSQLLMRSRSHYGLKPGLRWSKTLLLDCVGIEIGAIEIPGLLLRTALRRIRRQGFGDFANLPFRAVSQLDERAPTRSIRRNLAGFQPLPFCVSIKIIARLDRRVTGSQIQSPRADLRACGLRVSVVIFRVHRTSCQSQNQNPRNESSIHDHSSLDYWRHIVTANIPHPTISASPPRGVTTPRKRGAPNVSRYKLPLNKMIPASTSNADQRRSSPSTERIRTPMARSPSA